LSPQREIEGRNKLSIRTKKVLLKRHQHIRNVQELHTSNSSRPHDREHRPTVGMSRPLHQSLTRRRARALSADTRSITTATVPVRRAAVSANKCRVINNPFMEEIKIAETTAFAENCEKKIHKHRFRRKKRQKNQRNSQGE